MPNAAEASKRRVAATAAPKSFMRGIIPSASVPARSDGCQCLRLSGAQSYRRLVLDQALRRCVPYIMHPPEVLFRLRVQFAQLASLKTVISSGNGWKSYLHTNLGRCARNLTILLTALLLVDF